MNGDIYEQAKVKNDKGTRRFVTINPDHYISRHAKIGDNIVLIKRGREIRTWAIIDAVMDNYAVDEQFARLAKTAYSGSTLMHIERTCDGDIVRRRAVFTDY